MRDADLRSEDISTLTSVTELMEREWSPCRYHCPVHADVRGYIEAAAEGRWRDAIDIIRRNLPMAAVCGRICHHPCEDNCRRNDIDEPVAIREVKRFVAERQGAEGATVRKAPQQDKAAVAIVGSGPAGLAAALDLARLGYRPTVLEKFDVAGGICATAIPKYRLPRDVLQIDVDWVLAHGVQLQTGVEIGKDKTIEDLLGEGFEAVLIATGLAKSRTLPLPGADHPQVYPVLEFLTNVAFDRRPQIGRDVLVVGGGNVACDAARTAVRLRAERTRMMCLETAEEMPAWEWEIREAKEEGVGVIHRRGPVRIKLDDGRIVGLAHRRVTRVFDEDGRFDPQYDDSDRDELECDTVIMAIGQMPDMGFTTGSGLAVDDRGRLVFDQATHQTSDPRVFACGEIVTPPGSVVEACASGQRAARAIDLYLSGRPIRIDDALPPHIETISPETAEKVLKVDRQPVPTEPPEKRRTGFAEVDHTYDEAAATCESRRCMNCGAGAEVLVDKCTACLTCLRVCPFDIPNVTDVARIDSALCQACGMCIAECPANAIIARGRDIRALTAQTAGALERGGDGEVKIVAYVCGHHASAAAWRGELSSRVPGLAEIYLPSMARVSTGDLLRAFENGAEAVFVVACREGTERYPQTHLRTRRRVDQARKLLAEVGIDGSRLRLLDVADAGPEKVTAALTEAVESLDSEQESRES